ncbi:MAG: hypothetical protein UW14_C0003G0002 [Candidatus Yanofskybacteria bacterium GW2011_GWA2_44_10]|nr:MAG: hypothetical protein UW14_C0003G0002 [Candidatus Yanofskybacteria bacterium GW2011_GWA2_44_10]
MATITYYDILEMPLTLLEVHSYLINPARFLVRKRAIGDISIFQIAKEMEQLCRINILEEINGMYCLSGRRHIYKLRIGRQLLAAKKWKKFLRYVSWLSLVPYVRGVFASGSMALNNTNLESDFDVLVVIQSGRLYSGRLILSAWTSLLGIRRTKDDLIAPDKLCFNHYITDGNLKINHESLFNASTYARLIPVKASNQIYFSFYDRNGWINQYVYHFKPVAHFPKRQAKTYSWMEKIGRFGESILDTWFGNVFEYISRWYQQKRIRENPATYAQGGRIVFNDSELEFHPYSFEAYLIGNYNSGLKKLGIMPFIEERDSGLLAGPISMMIAN